jgi:hypothetical protein
MSRDVTLSDLDLTLPVPGGWEVGTVEAGEGSVVVLAPEPWGPERGFRPNLTVTAVESAPPLTPHRAGTEALALVLTDADTHVAGYDVWPSGRRLTRLSWVGGEQLVLVSWVLARAARVVTMTATVDVERWSTTRPLLEAVVREVRWADEPAAELPYERRWRRARLGPGPTEPRRDPDLVELGENLEDLSRVLGEQRFRPGGVTLDRETAVSLLTGNDGDLPLSSELTDVGLVTGEGPTEAGRRLRTIVREADRVLQVEATVGLLPLSFTLYRRGGDSVVVCTDGVSQWLGTDPHGRVLQQVPTRVHLMDLSTVGALGTLASWLGAGPAWSLAVDDRVPRELLTGRVQDPRTRAPGGASPQLRQVWSRIGALWTLRAHDVATGASVGTAVVDAADRGIYQLGGAGAEDGTLALHALPGAALLDELVRLVVDPARTWSAREKQEVS